MKSVSFFTQIPFVCCLLIVFHINLRRAHFYGLIVQIKIIKRDV